MPLMYTVLAANCRKIMDASDSYKCILTYGLSHQKRIRRTNPGHQDMLHDCAMKTRHVA